MKRWRGWEPATVYEHDEQGLLVRSAPETEWDDEQRGWMLALADYRSTRCPGCGNDLNETTAHEGEHTWRTHRDRCHACTTLAEAQSAAAQGQKNPMTSRGVLWSVTKVR